MHKTPCQLSLALLPLPPARASWDPRREEGPRAHTTPARRIQGRTWHHHHGLSCRHPDFSTPVHTYIKTHTQETQPTYARTHTHRRADMYICAAAAADRARRRPTHIGADIPKGKYTRRTITARGARGARVAGLRHVIGPPAGGVAATRPGGQAWGQSVTHSPAQPAGPVWLVR